MPVMRRPEEKKKWKAAAINGSQVDSFDEGVADGEAELTVVFDLLREASVKGSVLGSHG